MKGRQHTEAMRKVHDGREPCRDELQKYNISQIKDFQNFSTTLSDNRAANKEKQKALKRRSRKIKQRMTARGQEHEDLLKSEEIISLDSANKSKFRKNLKELDKLCQNHSKTTWSVVAVASLERCLGEITRSFSKSVSNLQSVNFLAQTQSLPKRYRFFFFLPVSVGSGYFLSIKWF